MTDNTWISDKENSQVSLYLDGADEFIIERNTLRNILIQLFNHTFENKQGLDLLELGAGNGYTSYGINRVFPDNNFTLLDGNAKMIEEAKKIFHDKKFKYLLLTFEDYISHIDNKKYDFIYSSNAIHHLPFSDKEKLFRSIYQRLKKGGLFINIDTIQPPSKECEQLAFSLWRNWMHQKQIAIESKDPKKYDFLPDAYIKKEENQPSGLFEQLQLLQKVGFTNVDCFYKYSIFAIFGGTK